MKITDARDKAKKEAKEKKLQTPRPSPEPQTETTHTSEQRITTHGGVATEDIEQFVIFQLGNEEYGIPIIQLRSVEKLIPVTRVPQMPNFIEGVVNLRGDLIPIVDLRKRFGSESKEETEKRIVVSKPIEGQIFGMIVDSVSEIQKVPVSKVDEMPPAISKIDKEHLRGAAKVGDRLFILIDMGSILSEVEKAALQSLDTDQTSVNQSQASEEKDSTRSDEKASTPSQES